MAYKKYKILSCFAVILTLLMVLSSISFHLVLAQGNNGQSYTLLEPLPDLSGTGKAPITSVNLGDYFQYAFNLLIALAAVAAVFMIVWGGFLYVTSDSWQKKNDGWHYFTNAIYGLLMVLGAFLILRTVNPKLVSFPTSIPAVQVPGSQLQSPLKLFEELTNEAKNYVAEARQHIIVGQQAQIAMDSLVKERDELQKQLDEEENSITRDPLKVADLQMQIEQKNKSISEKRTTIVSNATEANIINNSSITLEELKNRQNQFDSTNVAQSGIDYIQQQVNDATNRLSQSPEEVTAIKQLALYDQDTIKLTSIVNNINLVPTWSGLNRYNTDNTSASFKTTTLVQLTEIENDAKTLTDNDKRTLLLKRVQDARAALIDKFGTSGNFEGGGGSFQGKGATGNW